MKLEPQIVELLGRHLLIGELLKAGLEVAIPIRDRGVDLITYSDLTAHTPRFTACPIQMKASSVEGFGINRKYDKIRDLLLAYVWHVQDPKQVTIYAMRYTDAICVADEMGYTKTDSWRIKDAYSTTKPSEKLKELLKPYLMTSEKWRSVVIGQHRH